MSESAEDIFTVDYNGHPLVFHRLEEHGWRFLCPGGCCTAWHWIDTDSGTMHRITSAPGDPVSIVASLGCNCKARNPDGCRWHVMITNGVERDC